MSHGLRLSDLLFFDNLALFYVVNDTPPAILARVFLREDPRLAGSLLGVMSRKQRETVHALMRREDDGDGARDAAAADALLITAAGLIERGHIQKKARAFFGTPREDSQAGPLPVAASEDTPAGPPGS